MTLVDQLAGELAQLNAALAGLKPRPKGDPGQILKLAGEVRRESAAAMTAASRARRIPRQMDFSGPQAVTYRGHAAASGAVATAGAAELSAIAVDLMVQAARLAEKQARYDAHKNRLVSRRDAVSAQLRSLA